MAQRILDATRIATSISQRLNAAGIGHRVKHRPKHEMEAPLQIRSRNIRQCQRYRLHELATGFIEGFGEYLSADGLWLHGQPRAQLHESSAAEAIVRSNRQRWPKKRFKNLFQRWLPQINLCQQPQSLFGDRLRSRSKISESNCSFDPK